MGGKSSLQNAVSRESAGQQSYDLRSWQGLTDVLRAAKANLSPQEHAAFRDLVLQYAQRGGDAEVKQEIDAIIASFDAPRTTREEVPSPERSVDRAEESLSGRAKTPRRRPTPRFIPRSMVTLNEQPLDEVRKAVQPPPQREEKEPQEESRAPLAIDPTPEPRDVPSVTPEPLVPRAKSRSVEPEPVQAPVPERSSEVDVPPTPLRTIEEHKARITEIKRLVNEQIGNPVALVGSHKERGKEYMQALLAALKATGGGGVGVEAAMRRLEESYLALLHHEPEPIAAVVPEVVPSAVPQEPLAPTVSEPVVVPQEPLAPEPVVSRAQSQPVEEVAITPPQQPIPEPRTVVSEPVAEPPRVVPIARTIPEPIKATQPDVEKVSVKEQVIPAEVPPPFSVKEPNPEPEMVPDRESGKNPEISEKQPDTALPSQVSEIPTPPKSTPFSAQANLAARVKASEVSGSDRDVTPVRDTQSQLAPDAFPKTKYTEKRVGAASIASLAASGINTDAHEVQQSELVSPRITQALHELLHEWNIFSSSGFLGMGPSGAEHPLYIRLAPLTMGEIITGRYEGADRKVSNIIHDYVNAWRHEQGIAYTPNETFEHYLRRVVLRIQKRQAPETQR